MCRIIIILVEEEVLDLDTVLYDVVGLQDGYYYFHVSSACNIFAMKGGAKAFDKKQIKRLVSTYLKKLHDAKLLDCSPYPHTDVPRYRRTALFHEVSPFLNVKKEFTTTFLLELEMQLAFCKFEVMELCAQMEGNKELDYLTNKNKLDLLQEKICLIDKLLFMIKCTSSDLI